MKVVESINAALHDLVRCDERVYLIGEDLLDPYGGAFKATRGLSTLAADRVLSTPISEAAFTGFAVGMAMRGLRPIVEIMFGDFLTLAVDQLVNGAAKYGWMYGDEVEVPVLLRVPMGGRRGYGPTHSQTLDPMLMNVPGMDFLAPSLYHDAGAVLKTAMDDLRRPTLFIENKLLYPMEQRIPDGEGRVESFFVRSSRDEPGAARILSLSRSAAPDATLVAYGGMAQLAAEAALELFIEEEILVELVVPARICPLELEPVLESVRRSGRLLVAEEAVREHGWGAEVAARVQEELFDALRAPVARVGARALPVPAARTLEDQVLPGKSRLQAELQRLVEGSP